jgi:phospholipid/cholesterol/gamma-HCH transport system substrate-binding protein
MFSATSAQKVKLGLFLVAGAGLLFVILLLFAGLSLTEESDRYYLSTKESVSGLRIGATVEVRGVDVGQVAGVELAWDRPEPVRVAVDVAEGTPIPTAARAVLRMRGVTGLKYIDIDGGEFGGPVRKPGDTIPTAPSALSDITDQGRALVSESRQLIGESKEVAVRAADLLDEDNRARFDRMLERGDQMMVRGERAMVEIEKAATQLARVATRLDQLLGNEGARALESAGALMGDARRLVQANRHQVAATLGDLREAARSLRRMAQILEREPSRLLFGRRPGERSGGQGGSDR